jgi:hypothetical protein
VTAVRLKKDLGGALSQDTLRQLRADPLFQDRVDTLNVFGRLVAQYVSKCAFSSVHMPQLFTYLGGQTWSRANQTIAYSKWVSIWSNGTIESQLPLVEARPKPAHRDETTRAACSACGYYLKDSRAYVAAFLALLLRLSLRSKLQVLGRMYHLAPADLYDLDRDHFFELKAHLALVCSAKRRLLEQKPGQAVFHDPNQLRRQLHLVCYSVLSRPSHLTRLCSSTTSFGPRSCS